MKVIPAINCTAYDSAEEQIKKAREIIVAAHGDSEEKWVHIDLVDGKFAPNITWGSPGELKKLIKENEELKGVNFEIHLMVENPEDDIEEWFEAGAKRIIVHVEAIKDVQGVLDISKKYPDREITVAIVYSTLTKNIQPYLDVFNSFQVLAVSPGLAGQKFNMEALDKVKFLRGKLPNAKIEVDGGVNIETAKLAKEVGADIFVSASHIFKNVNPQEAYNNLYGTVTR